MFWAVHDGISKQIFKKKELAAAVENTIEYYEEQNTRLYEVNKKLKEDAQALVRAEYEQKIANLEEQLRLSYGEFTSQKEKDAYNDFEQRHMHDRLTSRANGGKAPYLIPTGTGIGTHLEVVCPICGEKEDITDMEVW